MTPEQLKASILKYAMQGKLVEQKPEDGTGEDSKVSSRENVCQTKLRMIYTSRYNLKSKD